MPQKGWEGAKITRFFEVFMKIRLGNPEIKGDKSITYPVPYRVKEDNFTLEATLRGYALMHSKQIKNLSDSNHHALQ